MTEPTTEPWKDPERLAEIARLGLTQGDADEVLDDLVQQAAEAVSLPISLVSIVLDEAQHFIASKGLSGWLAETRGTPVEWAFCRIAVAREEAFVVEDASTHPEVRTNPLVTREGIRCYLGVPMIPSRGTALGTLCVIGPEPRAFSAADRALVAELAQRAVDRLEARAAERGA